MPIMQPVWRLLHDEHGLNDPGDRRLFIVFRSWWEPAFI